MQRVTLNLGKGDFSQGWAMVTAQFWVAESAAPMQITGSLPAAPELASLYLRWQRLYEALYTHRGWRSLRASDFEIEEDEAYPTDVSEIAFKRLCDELHHTLNQWLNSNGFRNIDRHLRTRFTPNDEIQVIITAEDRQLLRIPWHLWHFFEDYPRAEPALSLPEYTRSLKSSTATIKQTINVLAILGNSKGINIANDQQLLQRLPNTELRLLVEPKLEDLNQNLWEPGWDILFFAGHSSGHEASSIGSRKTQSGKFYINTTESLAIEQLRFALKKAIERGLKLAIFNSCDGLGLAWDLADLQIPQVIVMREPVPDRVAQEFLKHFLTAFSDGQPLYLAVREAREKLQGLETDFFCASWLPVICQNPAELPMRWELGSEAAGKVAAKKSRTPPPKLQTLNSKITRVLLTSLLTTGFVFGMRSLGVLQPLELWSFDLLLQLRPRELPDQRFLIVTIDEADIQAQATEQRRGSLSDQALDQLLKTLEQHQARVIGLDIYRDFPASSSYPSLIAQLRQNQRLVAICKSSDAKFDPTGIAAPPEVPESRIGFSDFLEDRDGVLRRQLLFHSPDPASPCVAPYAFNTRLAFRYLESEGISPKFTPEGNLKLGQTVFQRLQAGMGGYQTIDAAGNQIFINYRSLPSLRDIAPHVSLTQVLQGKVRPESIQNRIVLVGVTATSSSDVWTTPYGSGTSDKIPGVMIQSHMTSQIISAVLDGRSLIWVWNPVGELLWIGMWAIIGGICVSFGGAPLQRGGLIVGAIAILIGSCWFLLIQGGWVPLIPAGVTFLGTVGITSYLNRKI
jgi:CHASE2 domain-containing sensor protein